VTWEDNTNKWDFARWDLSELTSEEVEAFWSVIGKGGGESKTDLELLAWDKAVRKNVPNFDFDYDRAGITTLEQMQHERDMYSNVDLELADGQTAENFWDEYRNPPT
jgi:hypothetical protein